MMEKISEILKEESGKSKMQRLRERKKSLLVVVALLYFSAFLTAYFGNPPLELGFPFVSLVLMYYVVFAIFSPLPPFEFLVISPILRWRNWIFAIGIPILVILRVIWIYEQTFYLAVITMFAIWALISVIPIACQVFWSRTFAKIKSEARKPLADSLLAYLPVTSFFLVILVSTAFLLLPPITNFYFFLIVSITVIATFLVAINFPFYVGAKRNREMKIRNLEQKQKNLTNEFHDSKRTTQKFDKLLDIWLKEKEISRIKSEPLHPYTRSWKMFVTIFYFMILPILGISVFEFLRGLI